MALTETDKNHVIQLAERIIQPENGMEKHFVNVCQGQGKACTPKEREWFAYWQKYSSERSQTKDSSKNTSKAKHQSSSNNTCNSSKTITSSTHVSPFSEKDILIICILATFANIRKVYSINTRNEQINYKFMKRNKQVGLKLKYIN